jgi:hypothetical protein
MEEKKPESKCLNCGATSEDAVLLQCENKGKTDWVCVRCLPILIHGAH